VSLLENILALDGPYVVWLGTEQWNEWGEVWPDSKGSGVYYSNKGRVLVEYLFDGTPEEIDAALRGLG